MHLNTNKSFKWHFKKKLSRILGRKKVLFLHTQKTAGTSIVTIAREVYGTDLISHGDYTNKTFEDINKISFISGHFGFDFASQFMEGRYSFTFLRDPIERILSFYYFCRKRNPKHFPIYATCHELGLSEFFELAASEQFIRQYIWNQMTWQLACGYESLSKMTMNDFSDDVLLEKALINIKQFSYIGFTETADNDIHHICKAISLAVPEQQVVLNSTIRPTKEMLTERELELALKCTELDYKVYNAAWQIFHTNQRLPTIVVDSLR